MNKRETGRVDPTTLSWEKLPESRVRTEDMEEKAEEEEEEEEK